MRKISALILTFMLMFSCSMSAFAAPKVMSDGNTFDAEYYAQNNPDVVKALGTDESALYQHYLNYGKAEGRLPYEGAKVTAATSAKSSKSTADKTTTVKTTTTTAQTTSQTVYITNTGSKYHNAGCSSLRKSKIAISLDDAKAKGYEPCKNCH